MKVVWVLENIKKHKSFYNKFDLLMMFASVIQWKKHHPTHLTEVHIDKLTERVFNNLGVLELWDNINILPENKFIDKDVFWASSKLEVFRYLKEPFVFMDNDFLVYKSLDKYLKDKVVVAHEEDGQNYYLGPTDPYIKQVKHIISRPKLEAINCSFLYFPDYKFSQAYAKTSLELMNELTRLKAPNSKYLIYAEQLLLKHLLDKHEIPYDSLVDRVYDCVSERFIKKIKGFIKYEHALKHYRHYWKEKNKIRDNKDGFSYKEEVKQLENIVNNRILVEWTNP